VLSRTSNEQKFLKSKTAALTYNASKKNSKKSKIIATKEKSYWKHQSANSYPPIRFMEIITLYYYYKFQHSALKRTNFEHLN